MSRRNRMIGLTCTGLLLIAVVLSNQTFTGPSPLKAQEGSGQAPPATATQEADIDHNDITEKKLAMHQAAKYVEIPLVDFLNDFAARYDVQTIINRRALDDAGIGTDSVVTVGLESVRGDMLLELVLEDLGLVYYLRDGIVIVTTDDDLSNRRVIQVYNSQDLESFPFRRRGGGPGFDMGMPGMPGGMPGMGMAAGMPGMAGDMMEGRMGMDGGMGSMGMSMGSMEMDRTPERPAEMLVRVIMETVEPNSWAENGGSGSIRSFAGGLLVVSNNPRVHRQLDKLLQDMRAARAK